MTWVRHFGLISAAAALALGARACFAQGTPTPCAAGPQAVPCSASTAPSDKAKSAAAFPFPEEESDGPRAKKSQPDGSPSLPSKADGKSGTGADTPANKAFPFPGEGPAADSGSSSSSSSSSGSAADPDGRAGYDPDAAGPKDKGSQGTVTPQGRRLLHRVNPVGTKLQSADDREAEDLDVAHFYSSTGDWKGAYLRGQDAVKIAPEDPDAHFLLAGIAQKLNKVDEAVAEYAACLKLDPPEKQAKAARRELARLKAQPGSALPK